MTETAELYGLCSLRGTFTEGRLLKVGFSKAAIGRAITRGALRTVHEGVRSTRHSPKIAESLEKDLKPGEQVFKYEKGAIRKLQVVKDDNGKVSTVDPERPRDGVNDDKREEVVGQDDAAEIEKALKDRKLNEADDREATDAWQRGYDEEPHGLEGNPRYDELLGHYNSGIAAREEDEANDSYNEDPDHNYRTLETASLRLSKTAKKLLENGAPDYRNAPIIGIGSVNLRTGANVMFGDIWDCWKLGDGANILVSDGETKSLRAIHTSGDGGAYKPGEKIGLVNDQTRKIISHVSVILAVYPHTKEGLMNLGGLTGKSSLPFYTFK